MIGRWLRAPALHMLALGVLLSAAVELRDSVLPAAKPRLEVASYRLQQARVELIERYSREPTDGEWEQIRQVLINEELLLEYALSLRLWEDSAVKARLALIAEFVDANPSAANREELVRSAMELGLHGSDLTVHFNVQDTGIFCNDTEVSLTGETGPGEVFISTDTIDATQCVTGGCHTY